MADYTPDAINFALAFNSDWWKFCAYLAAQITTLNASANTVNAKGAIITGFVDYLTKAAAANGNGAAIYDSVLPGSQPFLKAAGKAKNLDDAAALAALAAARTAAGNS
jgi:hypothetical protein